MVRIFIKNTLIVLLFGIIAANSVFAQATEEVDDRALILRAFSQLTRLDYHFTGENTSTGKGIFENGQTSSGYYHMEVSGDAAGNGDYRFDSTTNMGQSRETAQASEPLRVQVISAAGITYLNLMIENTSYPKNLGVEAGWWRYDDLEMRLKNGAIQWIEIFDRKRPPLQYIDHAEDILAVTDLGTGTVDGVPIRKYRVKIDPTLDLARETSEASQELLNNLRNANAMAGGKIDMQYQLWIGISDGLLYHATTQSQLDIPHALSGGRNPTVFHSISNGSGEFSITYLNRPVMISAPEPTLLHE